VVRRGASGGVCSLVNTKARGAWRHRKSRRAIVAVAVKTKALSLDGMCPPPGDLEATTLSGTCSPPGYFAAADWCYTCYDVRDLQGF